MAIFKVNLIPLGFMPQLDPKENPWDCCTDFFQPNAFQLLKQQC